jgi:hypothetical protein
MTAVFLYYERMRFLCDMISMKMGQDRIQLVRSSIGLFIGVFIALHNSVELQGLTRWREHQGMRFDRNRGVAL